MLVTPSDFFILSLAYTYQLLLPGKFSQKTRNLVLLPFDDKFMFR